MKYLNIILIASIPLIVSITCDTRANQQPANAQHEGKLTEIENFFKNGAASSIIGASEEVLKYITTILNGNPDNNNNNTDSPNDQYPPTSPAPTPTTTTSPSPAYPQISQNVTSPEY